MSTPASAARGQADAAVCGVRLTVPLRAGGLTAEIEIEAAHCERLFRMAAYRAIRDGRLAPGAAVSARLVAGRIAARHGDVLCLESCGVELRDAGGRCCAIVDFPREVFEAFATARMLHLLGARREADSPLFDAGPPARGDAQAVPRGAPAQGFGCAYSLHANPCDGEPFPVEIPLLEPIDLTEVTRRALPRGAPDALWIATVMSAEVGADLEELGRASRVSGLEAAARIHTRVGFDRERRCFVRLLDRLVVSRRIEATAESVVSTAASWGDFLAGAGGTGTCAPASVHTHLHLGHDAAASDGTPGDLLLESTSSLGAAADPCISIEDIVTHYTAFPDSLSAALIVSLFPGASVVTLYGYTPRAQLRQEPGYWLLPTPGRARRRARPGASEGG